MRVCMSCNQVIENDGPCDCIPLLSEDEIFLSEMREELESRRFGLMEFSNGRVIPARIIA